MKFETETGEFDFDAADKHYAKQSERVKHSKDVSHLHTPKRDVLMSVVVNVHAQEIIINGKPATA